MNDEFNTLDGDIILRDQGSPNRDFRVHKIVLSLASPVFKDMFSLPQPRSDALEAKGDADIRVVDMTDPPQALALVLKLIYPFIPPNIENLDLLVEDLIIADKYNIEGVRARLRVRLTKFADEDPLRVYAIASRFGFDEEAEAVSPLTTTTYLPALTELPDDFKYVPAPAYHKLVVLHTKHREPIEGINGVLFEAACGSCINTKVLGKWFMRRKLVSIICRRQPMTVPQCIEELRMPPCMQDCMIHSVRSVVEDLGKDTAIVLV